MGTMISLSVGGLDVDGAKNCRGADHGHLFQENDRMRLQSDQINYDYFEKANDPNLVEMEMGFSRPLRLVLPRLELLGYSLEGVEREYSRRSLESAEEGKSQCETGGRGTVSELLGFNAFFEFIKNNPLGDLSDEYVASGDKRDRRICGRFENEELIEKLPFRNPYGSSAYSELSYFGELISFMSPYSVLRLLGEHSANLDLPVVWQYGPLVHNGWAELDEFVPLARRSETFLLATEGSSDVHILRHALDLFRPDISDFFRFIDVSDSHPFSGTGSLHKFAEGLAKIDVHNQVVFVYDNDAEGYAAFQQSSQLRLPINMRVTMLPELDEFREFDTVGPSGVTKMNINRQAAAIECYLDLSHPNTPEPQIRWKHFKEALQGYHGALEHKTKFVKPFLNLRRDTLGSSSYDGSKIKCVLDMLYHECSSIAAQI